MMHAFSKRVRSTVTWSGWRRTVLQFACQLTELEASPYLKMQSQGSLRYHSMPESCNDKYESSRANERVFLSCIDSTAVVANHELRPLFEQCSIKGQPPKLKLQFIYSKLLNIVIN